MQAQRICFLNDLKVMTGRSMRHVFRSVDTIITVAITPIAMMLLFVYVFGGAIQTGMDNYVNYLLPVGVGRIFAKVGRQKICQLEPHK